VTCVPSSEADIERVRACSSRIRLLKVNQKTLTLSGANDTEHLTANLGLVFRDDMPKSHLDELVQLRAPSRRMSR